MADNNGKKRASDTGGEPPKKKTKKERKEERKEKRKKQQLTSTDQDTERAADGTDDDDQPVITQVREANPDLLGSILGLKKYKGEEWSDEVYEQLKAVLPWNASTILSNITTTKKELIEKIKKKPKLVLSVTANSPSTAVTAPKLPVTKKKRPAAEGGDGGTTDTAARPKRTRTLPPAAVEMKEKAEKTAVAIKAEKDKLKVLKEEAKTTAPDHNEKRVAKNKTAAKVSSHQRTYDALKSKYEHVKAQLAKSKVGSKDQIKQAERLKTTQFDIENQRQNLEDAKSQHSQALDDFDAVDAVQSAKEKAIEAQMAVSKKLVEEAQKKVHTLPVPMVAELSTYDVDFDDLNLWLQGSNFPQDTIEKSIAEILDLALEWFDGPATRRISRLLKEMETDFHNARQRPTQQASGSLSRTASQILDTLEKRLLEVKQLYWLADLSEKIDKGGDEDVPVQSKSDAEILAGITNGRTKKDRRYTECIKQGIGAQRYQNLIDEIAAKVEPEATRAKNDLITERKRWNLYKATGFKMSFLLSTLGVAMLGVLPDTFKPSVIQSWSNFQAQLMAHCLHRIVASSCGIKKLLDFFEPWLQAYLEAQNLEDQHFVIARRNYFERHVAQATDQIPISLEQLTDAFPADAMYHADDDVRYERGVNREDLLSLRDGQLILSTVLNAAIATQRREIDRNYASRNVEVPYHLMPFGALRMMGDIDESLVQQTTQGIQGRNILVIGLWHDDETVAHYTAVQVDIRNRAIVFADSLANSERTKRARRRIMDLLVRMGFAEEDGEDWNVITEYESSRHQQSNGHDCGVYATRNLLRFLQVPHRPEFGIADPSYWRRQFAEWIVTDMNRQRLEESGPGADETQNPNPQDSGVVQAPAQTSGGSDHAQEPTGQTSGRLQSPEATSDGEDPASPLQNGSPQQPSDALSGNNLNRQIQTANGQASDIADPEPTQRRRSTRIPRGKLEPAFKNMSDRLLEIPNNNGMQKKLTVAYLISKREDAKESMVGLRELLRDDDVSVADYEWNEIMNNFSNDTMGALPPKKPSKKGKGGQDGSEKKDAEGEDAEGDGDSGHSS